MCPSPPPGGVEEVAEPADVSRVDRRDEERPLDAGQRGVERGRIIQVASADLDALFAEIRRLVRVADQDADLHPPRRVG